jgi:hypothetical protein
MRRWLVIALLASSGAAAHAAPAGHVRMPLASGFDLTSFVVRSPADPNGHIAASRWLTADIARPPGPPHDPPLVKIRGKKVKFRMSF